MVKLGITLIVGAAAIFFYSCARGGYEAGLSYAVGVVTGALSGSGITLLL